MRIMSQLVSAACSARRQCSSTIAEGVFGAARRYVRTYVYLYRNICTYVCVYRGPSGEVALTALNRLIVFAADPPVGKQVLAAVAAGIGRRCGRPARR